MSSLGREGAEGKLFGRDMASSLLLKCFLIPLDLKHCSPFPTHSSVLWLKMHLKEHRTTFSHYDLLLQK